MQEQPAAISELLDTKSQEELRQLLTDEYGEAPGDDEADESVDDEDAQIPQPVLLTSSSPTLSSLSPQLFQCLHFLPLEHSNRSRC